MESLLELDFEFITKIGMCDIDELSCTLAERFALEVCNAVFGDDIVYIVTAGRDSCTFIEECNDLRSFALDGRRHCHDGFAVLCHACTANKLLSIVPASIKSGILMGAGFAAIFGEFAPGKRVDKLPITILVGAFVAFFCLFSQVFSAWRKKSKFWDTVGGLGMLPSVIVCIIVGVIVKEIVYDKFDVFPIFYVPDFKGIWNSMSPFALGWPTGQMFLKAIPQAIVTYIIAFGDFVTSEALLHEADVIRQDEKIVFDANRSNIISGVRNTVEGLVCPYPTLCGPLWAAVTASVSQRYKDGRDKMEFSRVDLLVRNVE